MQTPNRLLNWSIYFVNKCIFIRVIEKSSIYKHMDVQLMHFQLSEHPPPQLVQMIVVPLYLDLVNILLEYFDCVSKY